MFSTNDLKAKKTQCVAFGYCFDSNLFVLSSSKRFLVKVTHLTKIHEWKRRFSKTNNYFQTIEDQIGESRIQNWLLCWSEFACFVIYIHYVGLRYFLLGFAIMVSWVNIHNWINVNGELRVTKKIKSFCFHLKYAISWSWCLLTNKIVLQ
jgi:hypothetical protein